MKRNLLYLVISLTVMQLNAQNWNEVIKVVASDRSSDDRFGYSVSISGDYAIVGAYQEDEDSSENNTLSNAGSASIFEKDGAGNWVEVQKIVASDRASDDLFGYSVSISGNYAILGAYQEDEDASGNNTFYAAGSAYIFERDGLGNWVEVQKIVASDRWPNDNFGFSVSISGNYAIVGATQESEDALGNNSLVRSGSAYIFERNGTGIWLEAQKIVASDREANIYFGYSVAISGGYAIVGARYGSKDALGNNVLPQAGAAYVYERNGVGNWGEVQKIVASDRASGDFLGFSVSISGNYAIVGSHYDSEDALGNNTLLKSGSAYIFERNGVGNWMEIQKIVASDRFSQDRFGFSVSISGNHVIVGAIYEDQNALGNNTLSNAGSSYVFEKNGAGTWLEAQKIVASDRAAGDYFGYSVSISGNHFIAGAYREDEDASGNNTLSSAGAAYVFCASTAGVDTQVACSTYIWPLNSTIYTSSTNLPTVTLTNAIGCDSVVTLNLTINSNTGADTQVACNTYTWPLNSTTYTASTSTPTVILTNVTGCDSVVTLNLIINSGNTGIDTQAACNTYTWSLNSTTYTASTNIPTVTLTNLAGCDSVVTLNLTINTVDASTTTVGNTITAKQTGGAYMWIDCNNGNTAIIGETNVNYTAGSNGDYAVVVTLGGCIDTSACVNVIITSIIESAFGEEIKVYPNPTSNNVTIDFGISNWSNNQNTQVLIINIAGKEVYRLDKIIKSQLEIPLKDFNRGIYFLKIQDKENQKVVKLIKQ
ncbi:MAG: T9SS type A sorting domain-containing protein [Flavobacteriales bacterium]|nr:T9SS type A sorting domain-containing protein [Flavobacteriales bacterium]